MSGHDGEDIATAERPARSSGPYVWYECMASLAFLDAWRGWVQDPCDPNYREMVGARGLYFRAWTRWLQSEAPAKADIVAEIRNVASAMRHSAMVLPSGIMAAKDAAAEVTATLSAMRQIAGLLLEEVPADGR